jgi:hypothetical protein
MMNENGRIKKKENYKRRNASVYQFSLPGIFPFLRVSFLFLAFSVFAQAQNLPDTIRGYKVYDAKISVKTEAQKSSAKDESEALVKVGEPELVEVGLAGITFELSAEIAALEQSGTVDFLSFHDFRVNGLAVEVEEYKESFSFQKNKPVILPKPARVFLGASQTLRGAIKEVKDSKDEWRVTGRVFVFGKFKKFGFAFKRVVPVDVDITIKNPLKQNAQILSN